MPPQCRGSRKRSWNARILEATKGFRDVSPPTTRNPERYVGTRRGWRRGSSARRSRTASTLSRSWRRRGGSWRSCRKSGRFRPSPWGRGKTGGTLSRRWPVTIHTAKLISLTYLPTYLPTYIHTYKHTCLADGESVPWKCNKMSHYRPLYVYDIGLLKQHGNYQLQ